MGFHRQFDEFDPLNGLVPTFPFPNLPSIVERARRLLKNRTRDEIVNAARSTDFFIEEYFRNEKDDFIQRLLDRGGRELGYLPYESRNEAGVLELLDNWPSEIDDPPPDIPSPENTSEIEALKECIGRYSLDDDPEFPNGREHEYFAVLALWLVADAMHWLKWTSDPAAMTSALHKAFAPMPPGGFPDITETINNGMQQSRDRISAFVDSYQNFMQTYGLSDISVQMSNAGTSAVYAMDAVCYAEQLCATETLAKQLEKLRLQFHQAEQKTDALAEEKAKKKISHAATKAARKRHAETDAMKGEVFAWCAAHLNEYPSMESAAGVAIKLVPVAFRTARDWISEYRKTVQPARKP